MDVTELCHHKHVCRDRLVHGLLTDGGEETEWLNILFQRGNPLATRRCCDVVSTSTRCCDVDLTSTTLIQRRNNVVCPVRTSPTGEDLMSVSTRPHLSDGGGWSKMKVSFS